MPHKERNWKVIIPDLGTTINQERAAAQEWKRVADARLLFLQHIDKAMTLMIKRAAQVERVFNTSAPDLEIQNAPHSASGEETTRIIRAKMTAMFSFVENLTYEAIAAEQALVDVYAITQESRQTVRPSTDLAPAWDESFEPSMWGFLGETIGTLVPVSELSENEDEGQELTEHSATVVVAPQGQPVNQMLHFLNGRN